MIIDNSSRYIFLDFEFNTVKKIQEIVSVGVVECTKNFNIISTHHYLVKLSMYDYYTRELYHKKYISSHQLECLSNIIIEARKIAYGIIKSFESKEPI